jgi:hypothetical protein
VEPRKLEIVMRFRSIFLVAFAACDAPNPGAITFAERPGAGAIEPGPAAPDAGPGDPVFGTSTLAYQNPGVVANNANAEHEGTVEGKDCIAAGCHLDGNRPYLFGGTVYTTLQGGATVPRAEVRVTGPDGVEIGHAYTDQNGNFWLLQAGKTIPANSRVGVRAEGIPTPRLMPTAPPAGNQVGCSSTANLCHGTAATGRVFIQ